MTPGPVGPAQALSSGTRINSAIDRMGPSLLLPRTQTLSASVELAPADDAARAPHLQLVISGMSSPCRAMYALCSIELPLLPQRAGAQPLKHGPRQREA